MPYTTTVKALADLWNKDESTVRRILKKGTYKANGKVKKIPAQQINSTWAILDSWFEDEKRRLSAQ